MDSRHVERALHAQRWTVSYYPTSRAHGLVSIDVGKWKVGVAVFDPYGDLIRAVLITLPKAGGWGAAKMARKVTAFIRGLGGEYDYVIELPEVRDRFRVAKENIGQLRAVAATISNQLGYRAKRSYRPSEWKTNIDKRIHHARIREALAPHEQAMWDAGNHDVKDAIGIGMFALERTERSGVEAQA